MRVIWQFLQLKTIFKRAEHCDYSAQYIHFINYEDSFIIHFINSKNTIKHLSTIQMIKIFCFLIALYNELLI